jgi:hypothetical protein
MNGWWDRQQTSSRLNGDPAWADAEHAAELLRDALRRTGHIADVTGTRAVRNVVQRPAVQFGTMPPDVARDVARRLTCGERTLYIVRHGPISAADDHRGGDDVGTVTPCDETS